VSREIDGNAGDTGSTWNSLYRVSGAVAFILVGITLAQLVIFIASPPPDTVLDWLRLFQARPLVGLLDFELLLIVYVVLSIPLALALTGALYRVSPPFTVLFLALSLIGAGAFLVARPAFDLLYLSQQYAAATSEAQRAALLAAGEGKLAAFHGTAFQVSYVLGSLNGLILSGVMLRSSTFSRPTAYLRILSSVFDFGIFVPTVGLYISIFSVLFLATWHILVGLRLWRLGQRESTALLQPA
jgi:hypothetical protein